MKLRETSAVYYLTISALYLFFISDAASKILLYLSFDFTRVSLIVRILYEALFLTVILLFVNESRFFFLKLLTLAVVCFLIGQYVFLVSTEGIDNLFENISSFNKYFFVFIIYYAIYKLRDNPELLLKASDKLENIFLINAIATWVGFIAGVPFLRTYIGQSYRLGYSGFIPAQNEATFFLFIAVSFFYYKHFVLGQRSLKFFCVASAALLLGTKGIYLFLALLLFYHFVMNTNYKTKVYSALLASIGYSAARWLFNSAYAYDVLGYFIEKTKDYGLAFMLFSGRTSYLTMSYHEIIKHWTFVNVLFGGENQTKFMIEMDLFDLGLFLGLVGSFIYLCLAFTTLFKMKLTLKFNLFFIGSYFALAFMGGHFFGSAMNALYLCIMCLYVNLTQDQPENV